MHGACCHRRVLSLSLLGQDREGAEAFGGASASGSPQHLGGLSVWGASASGSTRSPSEPGTLGEPVLLGPHPVAATCQASGKLEIPAPGTLQEPQGTCVPRREGPWQRLGCERGRARRLSKILSWPAESPAGQARWLRWCSLMYRLDWGAHREPEQTGVPPPRFHTINVLQ